MLLPDDLDRVRISCLPPIEQVIGLLLVFLQAGAERERCDVHAQSRMHYLGMISASARRRYTHDYQVGWIFASRRRVLPFRGES
jgi:hypothetical protein